MAIWYAVCINEFDKNLGYGSEYYLEALAMVRELRNSYPEDNIYLYKVERKDALLMEEE